MGDFNKNAVMKVLLFKVGWYPSAKRLETEMNEVNEFKCSQALT
jgi:hypothetical protein